MTTPAVVLALTFTPGDMLTIIGAVAALITTLGAVIVNVIVAVRTSSKVDSVGLQVEDVKVKANIIEGHVNSSAAAAAAKIDALEKQIMSLLADKADKKEIAAVLAQATVTGTSVTPGP